MNKKEDVNKTKIAVGISIDDTIIEETTKANIKYNKPNYNPQTRKQYYDDGNAHKRAIDNAFSNAKNPKDPYSGAELLKKQRDAKIKYGEKWQRHAAEADHIDPLTNVVNRSKKYSFTTTDDVKTIANSDDNFQVMSRELNQGSKNIGKGGSTQEEWASDTQRMDGLAKALEDEKSIDEVKESIRVKGEKARKLNDRKLAKQNIKNTIGTFHEAGINAAGGAGATALTISGISNIVSVIKGEKSAENAIRDTIKDSGKAAITGYAMGGGMTVALRSLSNSSSKFLQSLANYNIPGKVITTIAITGDTLKEWAVGNISTEDCLIQLGDKGFSSITMGYSMTIGQAIIPVPILGAAIGSMVGYALATASYGTLLNAAKEKKLAHEERIAIERQCEEHIKLIQEYRQELEKQISTYLVSTAEVFQNAFDNIKLSLEVGDVDGFIKGANGITQALGKEPVFDNMEQLEAVMNNKETIKI